MVRHTRFILWISLFLLIIITGCTLRAPEAAPATPTGETGADVGGGSGGVAGRIWHDICAAPPAGAPAPDEAPSGCILDSGTGQYVGNGRLDVNEEGIEGVTVTLGEGACPSFGLASTQSGADGLYLFSGLGAGTYCVEIDPGHEQNAALLLPGRWTYPPIDDPASPNRMTVTLEDAEVRADLYFAWDFALSPPYEAPVETGTPTPETALETQAVTPTPEPTDSGTPTVTPTITPTYIAGDPRGSLGAPDWIDLFDKGAEWPLYEDDHVRFEIKDGKMKMTAFNPDYYNGWILTSVKTDDLYIEAPMKVDACSERDSYGLVFRSIRGDKGWEGYLFGITCDGQSILRYWDGEKMAKLSNYTPNTAIIPGSNQANRVGAWAEGGTLKFYVNGVEVAQVFDDTYTDGLFGVYIGSGSTPDLTVHLDEYAYWSLP
jgi:hypothetical protein